MCFIGACIKVNHLLIFCWRNIVYCQFNCWFKRQQFALSFNVSVFCGQLCSHVDTCAQAWNIIPFTINYITLFSTSSGKPHVCPSSCVSAFYVHSCGALCHAAFVPTHNSAKDGEETQLLRDNWRVIQHLLSLFLSHVLWHSSEWATTAACLQGTWKERSFIQRRIKWLGRERGERKTSALICWFTLNPGFGSHKCYSRAQLHCAFLLNAGKCLDTKSNSTDNLLSACCYRIFSSHISVLIYTSSLAHVSLSLRLIAVHSRPIKRQSHGVI